MLQELNAYVQVWIHIVPYVFLGMINCTLHRTTELGLAMRKSGPDSAPTKMRWVLLRPLAHLEVRLHEIIFDHDNVR